MFAHTLRVTVDILLLRRGPQDLPADWNLLATLAVLYLIVHFVQVRTAAETGPALLQALLATALLVVYVRAALRLREHLPRFVQTLSALLAVGILATLLLLGPTAMMAPFLEQMAQGKDVQSMDQPPIFALLASAVVSIWALIAYAHIYRHALDVPLGVGVLVALGFEILLLFVFGLLGGGAA